MTQISKDDIHENFMFVRSAIIALQQYRAVCFKLLEEPYRNLPVSFALDIAAIEQNLNKHADAYFESQIRNSENDDCKHIE